jgi:hypothetical protein
VYVTVLEVGLEEVPHELVYAPEVLLEMGVGVYEAGQNHIVLRVNDVLWVARHFHILADLDDAIVLDVDAAPRVNPPAPVHSGYEAAPDQDAGQPSQNPPNCRKYIHPLGH